MLKKTIAKLRRQPKSVRDGVAFWTAGSFAAIVFAAWLFTAPARYADMLVVDTDGDSSVKSFFGEISDQVAAVKEGIPEAADLETIKEAFVAPASTSTASTSPSQLPLVGATSTASSTATTARRMPAPEGPRFTSTSSYNGAVAPAPATNGVDAQPSTGASAEPRKEVRIVTVPASSQTTE